jgi:hypothetical protein
MDQNEIPQLLGLVNQLMITTRPDTFLGGYIAFWIADEVYLFPAVPQSRFRWPDPRGVDGPIWAALRKMVSGKLAAYPPIITPLDRMCDRLRLDDPERGLLRQLVMLREWPRAEDLFEGLMTFGKTDFVETLALCTGFGPREVAARLAPEGALTRSGAIVAEQLPYAETIHWRASPVLCAALNIQSSDGMGQTYLASTESETPAHAITA